MKRLTMMVAIMMTIALSANAQQQNNNQSNPQSKTCCQKEAKACNKDAKTCNKEGNA